jgi:hypothetical protein
MFTRRHLLVGAILLLVGARLTPPARSTLPDRLTDRQFWALSQRLSEDGGTFRSENLLSNERLMQHVIPALAREVRPGRAYLGVGPEQNYTYIAALKPSLAFIIDIRRGNLQLHLMYKALFALSADRVEFVSRLFSRARPAGVAATAPVEQIFAALVAGSASDALLAQNLAAVRTHLLTSRALPLRDEDLEGIKWIQQSFQSAGPSIQYSAQFGRSSSFPTYAELMTATDADGVARSYLSTDDAFRFVKELHAKNLIVPVVGDFAGEKALRAVGKYLSEHAALVGAFYLSNVEQYLGRDGRWHLFCRNVAALPIDAGSSFIRSIRDGSYTRGVGLSSVTGNMRAETRVCSR